MPPASCTPFTHIFDRSSPSPSFASSSGIPSPQAQNREAVSSHSNQSSLLQDFRPNTSHGPISVTKPIPPPASLPRKHDPSALNQRVVYPSKDSCYKYVFSHSPFGWMLTEPRIVSPSCFQAFRKEALSPVLRLKLESRLTLPTPARRQTRTDTTE